MAPKGCFLRLSVVPWVLNTGLCCFTGAICRIKPRLPRRREMATLGAPPAARLLRVRSEYACRDLLPLRDYINIT